jgi:hypothetical protein
MSNVRRHSGAHAIRSAMARVAPVEVRHIAPLGTNLEAPFQPCAFKASSSSRLAAPHPPAWPHSPASTRATSPLPFQAAAGAAYTGFSKSEGWRCRTQVPQHSAVSTAAAKRDRTYPTTLLSNAASSSCFASQAVGYSLPRALGRPSPLMPPNPSIEGTSTSGLRPLAAAPQVKR